MSRRKRRRKKSWRPPPLSEAQILAWADAHHEMTGQWPKRASFRSIIPGSGGETWSKIASALEKGTRGLPGRSSLARLLAKHRGVRNHLGLPPLSYEQILFWADAFHQKTGQWPHKDSSPQRIPDSNGEKWQPVDNAMRRGLRGLPGDYSLARLLEEHRGVRNVQNLPPLTIEQILAWADAHRERTGRWPVSTDWNKSIPDSNGETWASVQQALVKGVRGFPGGVSLADVLEEHRGLRNVNKLPPLTVKQILAWADAFQRRTGRWPQCHCSEQLIEGTSGERWSNIDQALRKGLRGLPGGSSLARLLVRHRGAPLYPKKRWEGSSTPSSSRNRTNPTPKEE